MPAARVRRHVALAAAVLLAGRLAAQGNSPPPLTVHAIWGTPAFASDRVPVVWMSDGKAYTTLDHDSSGATDLYRVDALTGRKELLLRGADFFPAAARRPIQIQDYHFSPPRSH